jgi:predicted small metal-binding protein
LEFQKKWESKRYAVRLYKYRERTGADNMERVSLASVKCRDLAMDCSFEAKRTTGQEIIRQLIEHTETYPDFPVLSAEALYQLKKGIMK